MVRKTVMAHAPDNANSAFLLAIWSRQDPMIFMVTKKHLMAHLTMQIPLFYWPFGHAKSQ
jgi:hypothetical protein